MKVNKFRAMRKLKLTDRIEDTFPEVRTDDPDIDSVGVRQTIGGRRLCPSSTVSPPR